MNAETGGLKGGGLARGLGGASALACAVVVAGAGCGVSLVAAAPASGTETTYRIVGGEISYDGSSTRKCPSSSTGTCGDQGNGVTRTSFTENHDTAASFSVYSPGLTATSEDPHAIVFAPLNIDSWNHTFNWTETFTSSYCGPTETTEYSHSDLQHDGGTSPSLYELAVRISARTGSNGLDISLAQPGDVGVYSIGIRYPEYETASSVLGTWETTSPCADRSSTSSSRENLLAYCPFDFYPCTPPRTAHGTATSDPPVCDQAGTCLVRARGSTRWSYGPEYGGDDVSGSTTITWSVDVEIRPEAGCVAGDKRFRTDRRHKAITSLPAAPDIDWYRAKVTTTYCVKNGKAWITDMELKPTIQNGAIPLLLQKFGWASLNPEDPEYSPIPKGGAVHASASTTYAMCFDPIVLLDKFALKKQIKKRMKNPLRRALTKLLEKAGIKKISKPVREEAVEKFKKRVDHAFRKGIIRTWLKKRHVPDLIARFAEKVANKNKGKLKAFLKDTVAVGAKNGRYDGLSASYASDRMINHAFRALGRATAFCGGRAAKESNFRMWTITYEAERKGRKVKISKEDVYKHPILSVRDY